ncbi:MAG: signal recognition particle-docking protein FtsY [Schleiferiaceae bacterium]|nr:signal recognition particle-docking protein FtsY [Schleiferiaceae bacterium]
MALFGLSKTKEALFGGISKLFGGKVSVDSATLDALEEALISADVGVETAIRLVEAVEERVARDKYVSEGDLRALIRAELADQFAAWADVKPIEVPAGQPRVVLVVGVNGVGKTTSVGKLAKKFRTEGQAVVLGAADTFRAAAVDQLRIWAERSGATFIEKGMNTDPAAVAYAAAEAGARNGGGVVLVDTAGRLHNKVNLMNELGKIRRVMDKVVPGAPHETWLVLDASTGQNAVNQAVEFSKVTPLTGLVLTKMDGTARGGVVLAIAEKLRVPVRYIGVGEGVDDLQEFDAKEFLNALLS